MPKSRRFEFIDATSNKFWEVSVAAAAVTVHYGRIGTDGQTKVKSYDSPAEAKAAAEKQIAEKVKKGYHEIGEGETAQPAATAKTPAKKAPAKKAPASNPDSNDATAGVAVDHHQLAAIRGLLGQNDIDAVRQGIGLLRALDKREIWEQLAKGSQIDDEGRLVSSHTSELRGAVSQAHRQEVALWVLRGSGALDTVKTLTLDACEALDNLDALCGLSSLETLCLEGCGSLTSLDTLRDLPALQELRLIECDAIERLDGLGAIQSLRTLRLWWCGTIVSLESLPQSLELQTLDLSWCKRVTDLTGLAGRSALQCLDISGCDELSRLDGIGDLPALQTLDLSWCLSLTSLAGLGSLPALQTLRLIGCDGFTSLEGLAAVPALQALEMEGVPPEVQASCRAQMTTASAASAPSNTLSGKTFLFTGTLTLMTRDEAEQLVEARGGTVLSSVSAKLHYLVAGEKAGSKLAKARTISSIAIVSEEEFQVMVGDPVDISHATRAIIAALQKIRLTHSVTVRAHLQSGATEKGHGSGEYDSQDFQMHYTLGWNEGYLEGEGFRISDVISALSKHPLSAIGSEHFPLSPGELKDGYGEEYQIKWKDGEPEDSPDGFTLYHQMEISDCDYSWHGAASLEIEVSNLSASFTVDS